ncbi:hypothetical protein [Helicobacter burdigaliensis]|uniref:hypothetical protein n=1 Tax=Helicobacter burdigaliensis TaxID=2315334 RepID=UPI0039E80829
MENAGSLGIGVVLGLANNQRNKNYKNTTTKSFYFLIKLLYATISPAVESIQIIVLVPC